MLPYLLNALEFVQRILLHVFPQGGTAGRRVLCHEWKLEDFRLEEAAGLLCRNRPDDVSDAVARLIEELWRRAAELHRRIDLALDPPRRFLAELFAPRREELHLDRCLRRQKMMDPEHDFLPRGSACSKHERRAERYCGDVDAFHVSS